MPLILSHVNPSLEVFTTKFPVCPSFWPPLMTRWREGYSAIVVFVQDGLIQNATGEQPEDDGALLVSGLQHGAIGRNA